MRVSIAHPIYNNRFNKLKSSSTTYTSTSTSTITTGLPSGSADGAETWNQYCMSGTDASGYLGLDCNKAGYIQKLIVGPSTHVSSTDVIQVFNFDASINTSIPSNGGAISVNEEAKIASFTAGDPVTYIVGGIPDGWHGSYPTGSTKGFSNGAIIDSEGHSGPFGFNILNIDTAVDNVRNYATLKLGRMMANTWYRLGVMYKTEGVVTNSTASMAVYQVDGLTNGIISNTDANSYAEGDGRVYLPTVSDWTEASIMFRTPHDMRTDDEPFLILNFPTLTEMTAMRIAGISLSTAIHASSSLYVGSSGESYSGATRGFTTLTDYIDSNSISVQRNITGKPSFTSDRTRYVANTRNFKELPCPMYNVSFRLGHVSDSVALEVQKLLEWQSRGHLINLFPDLEGMPYCLTGRFNMSNRTTVNITDLTDSTFSLRFEEVVL